RVWEIVAVAQGDVPRHRDVRVAHDRLEPVLVHRERGAEYAGSHVGHTRELEQPLHGPVLAERAVQDRDDDVDVGERRRDTLGRYRQRLDRGSSLALVERPYGARIECTRLAGFALPLPSALELDRQRLVAAGTELFR